MVGILVRLPLQRLDNSHSQTLTCRPAVEEGRDEQVLENGRVKEREQVDDGHEQNNQHMEVHGLDETTQR